MNCGIMIAGIYSDSDKTLMSLGIMSALSKKCKVIPFKIGSDHIDPSYHKLATGSFSYNLDLHMLGEEKLKGLFWEIGSKGDISVVEVGYASSAHIAKLLEIPVFLVVDAAEMTKSPSAVVRVFQDFNRSFNLAGVLFNYVDGWEHFQILKEFIETDAKIPVVGYMPADAFLLMPEGILHFKDSKELDIVEGINRLTRLVEECIDLDWILKYAQMAAPIPCLQKNLNSSSYIGTKMVSSGIF